VDLELRVIVAALVGCGDCPPPQVSGGTASERDEVEETVAEFLEALVEPICVDHLRLADAMHHRNGSYHSITHRVRVLSGMSSAETQKVVRHELCHAVQRQQDVDVDDEVWSMTAPGYSRAAVGMEAFARTCEVGPETLWLLGESCADDTDGAVFAIAGERFLAPPSAIERTFVWSEVASLPGIGGAVVDVDATIDDTLRIEVVDDGGARSVTYVDPWTAATRTIGLPVSESAPWVPSRTTAEAAAVAGDATLMVVRAVAPNGGTVRRLVYLDGEGASRVGCVRDGEQPFAAGGQLWSAWRDADVLRWGAWSADE
jgi:hypothetical protein